MSRGQRLVRIRPEWPHLTAWLTGAVTAAVIVGYVALSLTVDGLPSYPAVGWVAVIQPADQPAGDVVQLLVQARTDGGQTRAAYDVAVCGPHPYTGDLLIGGPARFSKTVRNPLLPASSPTPPVRNLRDLTFASVVPSTLAPSR